jgi:hypothetical protein
MWIVIFQMKIAGLEVKYFLNSWIDAKRGQWPNIAGQLEPGLIQVIEVQVGIAKRVYEIAWL